MNEDLSQLGPEYIKLIDGQIVRRDAEKWAREREGVMMNETTQPAVAGPLEPAVRLCRDCRHSMPEPGSERNLRCMHPSVNREDPWALAGAKPHGSCARYERSRKWVYQCGMKGALWEPKAKRVFRIEIDA